METEALKHIFGRVRLNVFSIRGNGLDLKLLSVTLRGGLDRWRLLLFVVCAVYVLLVSFDLGCGSTAG